MGAAEDSATVAWQWGEAHLMSVQTYCFKAMQDLPDIGILAGERLLITPQDPEHPLLSAHPIDITPAQFFDAVMAGTLRPDHCPHDGHANPLYAIRNDLKWPWQDPVAVEDIPEDRVLTQDEAVETVYQAAMKVLPEPVGGVREGRATQCANLVVPELSRMGCHIVGPEPIQRPTKSGLRLDVG